MTDYRRGAHTVFEIHLHLVWITKYRRPALTGEVATRVRDLIRDICAQQEVNIMKGHVAKDPASVLPPEALDDSIPSDREAWLSAAWDDSLEPVDSSGSNWRMTSY
jgi:putative transposase